MRIERVAKLFILLFGSTLQVFFANCIRIKHCCDRKILSDMTAFFYWINSTAYRRNTRAIWMFLLVNVRKLS